MLCFFITAIISKLNSKHDVPLSDKIFRFKQVKFGRLATNAAGVTQGGRIHIF